MKVSKESTMWYDRTNEIWEKKMKNLKEIVKTRLGKKRMEIVEDIGLDDELLDVMLVDGYRNTDIGTRIWRWGLYNFEVDGLTRKVMLTNLIDWFDDVEKERGCDKTIPLC